MGGNKRNFGRPRERAFGFFGGEIGTSYSWRPWRHGGSSFFSDQAELLDESNIVLEECQGQSPPQRSFQPSAVSISKSWEPGTQPTGDWWPVGWVADSRVPVGERGSASLFGFHCRMSLSLLCWRRERVGRMRLTSDKGQAYIEQ